MVIQPAAEVVDGRILRSLAQVSIFLANLSLPSRSIQPYTTCIQNKTRGREDEWKRVLSLWPQEWEAGTAV